MKYIESKSQYCYNDSVGLFQYDTDFINIVDRYHRWIVNFNYKSIRQFFSTKINRILYRYKKDLSLNL